MVRTYWLVPVFYEASGVLDLQPFARATTSKPVAPVLSATDSSPAPAQPHTCVQMNALAKQSAPPTGNVVQVWPMPWDQ
jgi:hypothetical protein